MATHLGCKIEFEEDANSVFVTTKEPEGGTNVYEADALDMCPSGVKFDTQSDTGPTFRIFVPWTNVERVSQQLMDDDQSLWSW